MTWTPRLSIYALVLETGVLIGLAAALWWQGSRLDAVTREYSDYVIHAETNAKMTEAKRIATQIRWKKEIENAEENSRRREAAHEVAVADSRVALDRLRRATPPCNPALPTLPERPQLRQPLPSQGYMKSARERIETWQRLVNDMLTTSEVQLNSQGGDVDAAIAIGRSLRAVQAVASIGEIHECLSACVFVLAGATQRWVYGSVGIHRPYSERTGDVTFAKAQQEYRQLAERSKKYLLGKH